MYSSNLCDLIFKNQEHDFEYYSNLYTKRKEDMIVRFAPSPTGFLHTGSLYTALINYKLAKDNNGIFYLRIEDTDTKRTIDGSMETLKDQLNYFGISYDNEPLYGPYMQSLRKDIYNACIIKLLKEGKAYPCFLTEEEISSIRASQESQNLRTGIYKEFAKYRDINEQEAIDRINDGQSYVIRLKSTGDFNKKFTFKDKLHGSLSLPQNDQDIVILKQDKLPTYHFAHAVDDHFMGTTYVIRGEEWLTSAPIHVEMFNALGFELPNYVHLDSIMKLDNGNKRKLSKRKDPEASVSYLIELGYPKEAIINYLMTLANSNYEEYFMSNKTNDITKFKLSYDKMSKTGALFDMNKLNSVSKETIGFMDIDYLVNSVKSWSMTNDLKLYNLIIEDENKFKSILSIGRSSLNPRKEYERFDQIFEKIKFFYNDYYKDMSIEINYDNDLIKKVCDSFLQADISMSEDEWTNSLKNKAFELGFAKNKKEKENLNMPYIFGEYMKIIRNLICKSDNSPSIYEVINILGIDEVKRRLLNV